MHVYIYTQYTLLCNFCISAFCHSEGYSNPCHAMFWGRATVGQAGIDHDRDPPRSATDLSVSDGARGARQTNH